MSDTEQQAAGTVETKADFAKSPSDFVRNWLSAIAMAGDEEKNWREDAEATLKRYRAEKAKSRNYNILFANTQTKVPALYNSEPAPDIRRRFADEDEAGETLAEMLERALSIQSELYDLDSVLQAAVLDRELQGRGVSRLRIRKGENGSRWIECEAIQWDDFRRGPAKIWKDVPWIAYRWRMTREELVALNEKIGPDVTLDVVAGDAPKKDDNLPDMFKRATVWEIWDVSTRKIHFIAESFKDGALASVDDSYKLRGFFPSPKPLYSVKATHTLVPVCEFMVWKPLADEMDDLTARISGIVKVIKARGIYDGAFAKAISAMSGMDDGELAPIEDAARAMQQGGIDKAVWMWPVDTAIAVVKELYESRERCKQTIYEITGVADILRGSTDPNETLGAQQLKAQWGSLRLQEAQREVQRYARDIYRMMADLLGEVFELPELIAMTNQEFGKAPPQGAPPDVVMQAQADRQQLLAKVAKLLKSDLQREFAIEIETDSTIRADLSRAQENVTGFVTGFGGFIQSIGPAVQFGMMPGEIAVKLLTAFARNYKLGREAEDALDEWQNYLEQKSQQPPPPDPKQQTEQIKAQAQGAKSQAEIAKAQIGAHTAVIKGQAEQAKAKLALVQTVAEHHAGVAQHMMDAQAMQQQAELSAQEHQQAMQQAMQPPEAPQ